MSYPQTPKTVNMIDIAAARQTALKPVEHSGDWVDLQELVLDLCDEIERLRATS